MTTNKTTAPPASVKLTPGQRRIGDIRDACMQARDLLQGVNGKVNTWRQVDEKTGGSDSLSRALFAALPIATYVCGMAINGLLESISFIETSVVEEPAPPPKLFVPGRDS